MKFIQSQNVLFVLMAACATLNLAAMQQAAQQPVAIKAIITNKTDRRRSLTLSHRMGAYGDDLVFNVRSGETITIPESAEPLNVLVIQ